MFVNTLVFAKWAVMRQKWIFISAAGLLLFLWGVLYHSIDKGVSRSLVEQESSSKLLVHALEDSMVRSFQAVNASMQSLVEGLPQMEDPSDIERVLKEQLRVSPQLRAIDLLDATGVTQATVTGDLAVAVGYPCIQQLQQDEMLEFVIDEPKPGRYPNDPFATRVSQSHIPLCIPVRAAKAESVFTIVASINPQYFGNLFNSVSSSERSFVHLHRYDGVELIRGGSIEPHKPTLLHHLSERSWGQYREMIDGKSYLVSYRSTSLLPLVMVLVSDDEVALLSWKHDERMMRFFLIFASVLIISGAVVIAFLLEKRKLALGDNLLLSTAIRSAANAIFITDRSGKIHWTNKAFTDLTGYSFEEVRSKNPKILNSGCHSAKFFKELWTSILGGSTWRGELINRHKRGHTMTVEQTITPIVNDAGGIEHFVAVHEDVTARKSAEQRALFLADHDPLTSLPNRRFFEKKIYQVFSQNTAAQSSVFFIDLDRFKEINDTMGHEAGDALLTQTSERLKQALPHECLLARLGGDEFAVLTKGLGDHHKQAELAETIIALIAEPFQYGDGVFNVTCSVGIALGGVAVKDASMMLRQADMAMYRAKHDGKNTYRFFDAAMDELMKRRVFLQQQLELAVHRDKDLSIRYQPQVDALSGEVYGAEALLRWEVDEGEWVSPAEFITLAEETGQILEVGVWLMESLFRQMADWNARGINFGIISMNISSVQLSRDALAERLLELMNRFSVPCHQVCIEITETTLMADTEMVSENLKRLKSAGITLSIDDFGTGYSSMGYLKQLDADHLKIDRSFIIGIGENESDEHIVRATTVLAHSLGMEVVAEGVDSDVQLEFLRSISCNYIQGFLFAKPLDCQAFEAYVSRHNACGSMGEGVCQV